MSLLLLSLRTRRHSRKQRASITGEEVWSRDPAQGGCLRGRLVGSGGGGRGDTFLAGETGATDKLLLLHGHSVTQTGFTSTGAICWFGIMPRTLNNTLMQKYFRQKWCNENTTLTNHTSHKKITQTNTHQHYFN